MKPARPCYVIVLRAEPEVREPVIALRAALKTLLRRHGLRCLDIREERQADTVEVSP